MNPVSRLASLLRKIQEQRNAPKTRGTLAKAFEVGSQDNEALLLAISSLFQLLAEAKSLVATVDGGRNPGLHMAPFFQLEKTFRAFNLDASPKSLIEGIDAAIEKLLYSADLVERHLEREYSASGEVLSALADQVTRQIEELLASDLPHEAKRVLHERLKAVRDAAERIHLYGPEELETALDAAIGAQARYRKQASDSQVAVLDGVLKVVELGSKLLDMFERLGQLPGAVRKALGSGE